MALQTWGSLTCEAESRDSDRHLGTQHVGPPSDVSRNHTSKSGEREGIGWTAIQATGRSQNTFKNKHKKLSRKGLRRAYGIKGIRYRDDKIQTFFDTERGF